MRLVKAIFLSLFILSIYASQIHSGQSQFEPTLTCESVDKFYIPSSDILVTDSRFFVFIDNQLYAVNSIHSDCGGIYIESPNVYEEAWLCTKCFQANTGSGNKCRYCGAAR